jgi:hypothetical protein
MFDWEYCPALDRELEEVPNGDWLATLSSGPPPPPAFERDSGFGRVCAAIADWAELRPSSDSELGCTRRVMSSLRRLSSRAMTRVISRSVRAPTSWNVREISSAVLACPGERVVRGPVTTTPVALP